ncbi:MAG: hypothetical protein P4K93_04370 [Terracidiphilus sp.]|nr:hypothetical protein [Terracidiphilus sp.]
MRKLFENFVMYSDFPQRHYRQIAALLEDGMFKCSRWEGEILHAEPFERTNPDAEILICASEEDAVASARADHKESLSEGWHNYDPSGP